MIRLKNASEVEKLRAAGKLVARAIRVCSEAIEPGKTTPAMLDKLATRIIEEGNGKPSFLGYRGYPAATCISVNEVVIHGIPNDVPLESGDIVDIDIGVMLDGWMGDGAWTFGVGEISPAAQKLLNITKESLMQGIAKAKIGNRTGDIGATIQKYCESHGYGVVRDLVGHGIGRSPHEEPSVPNYGKPGKGDLLKPGMVFCIEPMINAGTYQIKTLADKWTMVTADGSLSAHFEHMVAVTKNGPDILTLE